MKMQLHHHGDATASPWRCNCIIVEMQLHHRGDAKRTSRLLSAHYTSCRPAADIAGKALGSVNSRLVGSSDTLNADGLTVKPRQFFDLLCERLEASRKGGGE